MKIGLNINYDVNEDNMRDAAREVLFQAMHKMDEFATEKCPVDTGRLVNSLHLDPIGRSDRIIYSDGVDYGIDQEYKFNPFMRPALDRVKQLLPKIWKDVLSRM